MNVSVAIRTSYHLYQGRIGSISILVIRLILFGGWLDVGGCGRRSWRMARWICWG
ncbi:MULTISPECIES: hypothetical protein [Xanthomonas]|uniref:Uncharacterized protein n=1 Tax=Xanthomonas dyei TaxID=743699 RepID=A0ABZ0D7Q9_9XANT|nr:hypothetical protein [Xanthomonas dyei]WOB26245.1 hypothetical protein NYR99_21800 [Xanthomonas dyei]WOB53867.1 hypothetical protein NYR95_21805 [Xanthomonas dyei]